MTFLFPLLIFFLCTPHFSPHFPPLSFLFPPSFFQHICFFLPSPYPFQVFFISPTILTILISSLKLIKSLFSSSTSTTFSFPSSFSPSLELSLYAISLPHQPFTPPVILFPFLYPFKFHLTSIFFNPTTSSEAKVYYRDGVREKEG